MAFSSQRGRPKKSHPARDLGTEELQRKRLHHLTAEPLDMCLEKGIISEQQHWCGIHLRWLYTLRYGAPNISNRDLTISKHGIVRQDDPEWRASREFEYHEATALLHQYKYYEEVMNLTVYQEIPVFLNQQLQQRLRGNPSLHRHLDAARLRVIGGLKCLESLWCKEQLRQKRRESNTTGEICDHKISTKSISCLVH